MRKFVVLAAAVALMAGGAQASRPYTWQHDLGPAFGGSAGTGVESMTAGQGTGWAIVLYKDGGDGLMSGFTRDPLGLGATMSSGDDVFATDDANTVMASVQTTGDSGGSTYLFWYSSINVEVGVDVFTVVFNNADMNAADHYLIVDDSLFNTSGQPPYTPADYNAGSASAGEWQEIAVVPEPSTLALMALGLVGLAAKRIRRKK